MKSTCSLSYLCAERPRFFAAAPLLSASVELSCFNLAAPRKGNPCVAYGHHLLRWLGDSGHGRKVPGSWHGQAAKPALGKCWQPAVQPCYKLIPILHKLLCGSASSVRQLLWVPGHCWPHTWLFHKSKVPQDSSACQTTSDLEEVSLHRAQQRTQ